MGEEKSCKRERSFCKDRLLLIFKRQTDILSFVACVRVCVCVGVREEKRKKMRGELTFRQDTTNRHKSHQPTLCACAFVVCVGLGVCVCVCVCVCVLG